MTKIKHDIWQNPDGLTMLCFSGELGEQSRTLLEPNSKVINSFFAESHFEAMNKYYDHMDWGKYESEFEIDKQPYDLKAVIKKNESRKKSLNEGDKVTKAELVKTWKEILERYDDMIENGHNLRPLRFLIRHIIENKYSEHLFGGTSFYSLLISIPKNHIIDFNRTLRVEYNQLTQTVTFAYKNKDGKNSNKKAEWIEDCQATEINDIFENFIIEHPEWKSASRK